MHQNLSISVSEISKSYNGTEVLKEISFSINKGETVGIIGPNGAGKSTLLKILSGIVRPTAGNAVLHGSVASILEIGMGLHPDLSGQENVFFVGRMMGHSQKEIQDKFGEIVAFSELEGHMQKLIKFYSSGMYLRLAFSIFALLDTDILLLDEVLSVGDMSFRQKSFDWMTDYKRNNKTIVLVSHNLNEIENFCDRIIYMDTTVRSDNKSIRKAILHYLGDHPNEPKIIDPNWLTVDSITKHYGKDQILVRNTHFDIETVRLKNENGKVCDLFTYDDEIKISLDYRLNQTGVNISFVWKLFDMNESLLFASSPVFDEKYESILDQPNIKINEVTVLPRRFLNTGRYNLTLVCIQNNQLIATYHRMLGFEVQQSSWMLEEPWANIPAPILHNFSWKKNNKSSGGE